MPQEIYIDVESHEMVDVGDGKRDPYTPTEVVGEPDHKILSSTDGDETTRRIMST